MSMEDYTKTLYDKLKSNYQPTEQEVLRMRGFLNQQLANLSHAEQQIQSTHGSLLKDLADARCQIDDLHTVLAPLRRIPSEIWGEIFTLCLPTDRNAAMTNKEAPLLLGLVCKRWRNISIANQKLWTTIHIPLLLSRPYQSRPDTLHLEILQSTAVNKWLDRSGDHPLSISLSELNLGGRNEAGSQPSGTLMIDTLIQYSSRWRKLEVTCSHSTFMRLVLVPGEDCSLLESLSIKVSIPSPMNVGATNAALLLEHTNAALLLEHTNAALLLAPRLFTLRLINLPGNALMYFMGWHGISELFLDSDDPTTLVPSVFVTLLLTMCGMLVRCRIKVLGHPDHPNATATPVTAFFLKELWITEYRLPPHQCYNALTTPALIEFKLDSEHITRDTFEFPVVDFLCRCPRLETLTLNPAGLHNVHIVQALRACPLITTLILQADNENKNHVIMVGPHGSSSSRTYPVNDQLLQALTVPDSPTLDNADYLCKYLQHFQCKRNAISDEILLQFIKSRTDPNRGWVEQLKTVTISRFYRRWTIDVRAHLAAEIENGLEVELQYFESKPVRPSTGMCWNDSVDNGTTLLKVTR